jgi:glycogen debranching enzyme
VSGSPLVDEAYARAIDVLRGNARDIGLLSARHAYQQVNGRDSMICGLGLLLLDDSLAMTHRRSLESLGTFQSRLGNIPFGVGFPDVPDASFVAIGGTFARSEDAAATTGPVVDTLHAGCVDNPLWYILGHWLYQQRAPDLAFLQRWWPSLQRAFTWLEYQDINECGLLEVHEAMDWADLFANRYNVLYDNALWYAALLAMAGLARLLDEQDAAGAYAARAEDCRFKLNLLLWVGPEQRRDLDWVSAHRQEWLYPIKRTDTELVVRPYYLPYMGFRDFADRFDTLGNLLAIVLGVASQTQAERILDYAHGVGLDEPYPIQVLYPVIRHGEPDWRHYYLVRNLNQPHHYHNGGIWPFVGGFYVAALVRAGRQVEAADQLERLALLNQQGQREAWEFTEWAHGTSGRPMGFPGQSWSAALYVYAYECVKRAATPFFAAPLRST